MYDLRPRPRCAHAPPLNPAGTACTYASYLYIYPYIVVLTWSQITSGFRTSSAGGENDNVMIILVGNGME